LLIVLVISFLLLITIGVPIAFAMGASSLLSLFADGGLGLALIPQRMFTGINSFALLAIPLFVLAGSIMEHGGISRRLVNFSNSIVGYVSGGLGLSTVLTSIVFAGVSGSAAADTAAVGSVMMPAMKKKGYPTGLAATILACAGSLGPIIPPSLTMILYAVITNVSIVGLFISGIIPGLLMGLGLMLLTYYYGRKLNLKEEGKPSFKEIGKATWDAVWALVMPIIVLGGIVLGYFTATEAGVIAVVYALVISMFVYKELDMKGLYKVFVESAATTSMIAVIIAGAGILGWLIAFGKLPLMVVGFLTSITDNPTVLLLLIVAFIVFLGMFIETIAATIILAPILAPLVTTIGYDPIYFGFVIVASLVFAGITPPVGAILNIAIGIGKGKLKETIPYVIPYFLVMLLVVILVVFIPQIATYLPSVLLVQ